MDVTWIEEAGGFGMIPDGFDPSRETPQTADRDSEGPARLAGLMRDMDRLSEEVYKPVHDHVDRAKMLADTWRKIRQEMSK